MPSPSPGPVLDKEKGLHMPMPEEHERLPSTLNSSMGLDQEKPRTPLSASNHVPAATSLGRQGVKSQQNANPQHEASTAGIEDSSSTDEEPARIAPLDAKMNEKGFVVDWDGETDPMNPRNMPRMRKWMIVAIMVSGAVCV